MNEQCRLYEDLLVKETLGEISEKEKAFLKVHLDACADCRRQLAVLSDTVGVLRRERIAYAPAGLAERTFHRIGSVGERLNAAAASFEGTELLKPSTWRVRKSLVGWMVAASIMVMAVASLVPGNLASIDDDAIAASRGKMQLIAISLRQYAVEHNDFYPEGPEWYMALDYEYLRRNGAFVFPGRVAVGPLGQPDIDYLYTPQKASIHSGDDYPLMWTRRPVIDRPGRNVLFAAGRIAWVTEDDFQFLLARYKINEAHAH